MCSSDLSTSSSLSSWNDPNNPANTNGPDTAYSVIQDSLYGQNSLRIRIDYELVDLGQQDANGVGGSPIAFRDANGIPVFVYSERYILLQTYEFKNISASENVV